MSDEPKVVKKGGALRNDLRLILGEYDLQSKLPDSEPSFANLLSDTTRRMRRTQLATASIGIFFGLTGVSPKNISALGITFPSAVSWTFPLSLLILHLYVTGEFWYFVRNDFHEWLRNAISRADEVARDRAADPTRYQAPSAKHRDAFVKSEADDASNRAISGVAAAIEGRRVSGRLYVEILLPLYYAFLATLVLGWRSAAALLTHFFP